MDPILIASAIAALACGVAGVVALYRTGQRVWDEVRAADRAGAWNEATRVTRLEDGGVRVTLHGRSGRTVGRAMATGTRAVVAVRLEDGGEVTVPLEEVDG